jgi:hypothetical protein
MVQICIYMTNKTRFSCSQESEMRLHLIIHVKRCQDKNMTCHRNPSPIYNITITIVDYPPSSLLFKARHIGDYSVSFRWNVFIWAQQVHRASICLRTNWAKLSRFHLKTETESSLRNVALKSRTMDKVQNCDSCINIPSPQTYR